MKIDLPYLDAWFDCWLIQIQTAIWRTAWHSDCRDYVILDCRILRKWGFRFRLYDTGIRMFERNARKLKMKDATHGQLPLVSTLPGDERGT
jgi:hypothetical protein